MPVHQAYRYPITKKNDRKGVGCEETNGAAGVLPAFRLFA
jgi:hypothetical protein